MTTRDAGLTVAALVALAASSLAGLMSWMLVTSPAALAIAAQDGGLRPLAQLTLRALHDILARLAGCF